MVLPQQRVFLSELFQAQGVYNLLKVSNVISKTKAINQVLIKKIDE